MKHKHPAYRPSETRLALYPVINMITCRCGIQFTARSIPFHDEDDPELCLGCNRKSWSRLFSAGQSTVTPLEATEVNAPIGAGDVVPITRKHR